MPFKIPDGYSNPTFTTVAEVDSLRLYIAWLRRELDLAERALFLLQPLPPKPASPNNFASAGGKARSAKMTPDQRKECASKAAKARWAKNKAQ